MNWLEPYVRTFDDQEGSIEEAVQSLYAKKIESHGFTKKFSPLTQFFLLLSLQAMDGMTYLPVTNPKILTKELCEIFLHYDERKRFFTNHEPDQILIRQAPSRFHYPHPQ